MNGRLVGEDPFLALDLGEECPGKCLENRGEDGRYKLGEAGSHRLGELGRVDPLRDGEGNGETGQAKGGPVGLFGSGRFCFSFKGWREVFRLLGRGEGLKGRGF